MFEYVYLDGIKTMDVRLKNVDDNNFHEKMENLGIINWVVIICWELEIKHILIDNIIGHIQFANLFNNYNIIKTDNLNANYIEIINDTIKIVYNNNTIIFNIGLLYFKQNKFPNIKMKIRPEILYSAPFTFSNKKKNEIFSLFGSTFALLAAHNNNEFKVFIPDVKSKEELKYVSFVETNMPKKIINNNLFNTRNYCLLFYNNCVPTHVLYLSGQNNINYADTVFQSLLYNCLPTPKFSNDKSNLINYNKYINNNSRAIAIDPPESNDKDDAISFNIIYENNEPKILELFVHISDANSILNYDNNKYHFLYALHKQETDYMFSCRYQMIDSINSISLIGPDKRCYTIKISYKFNSNNKIYNIPNSVEMYLEKNVKIFATTYDKISNLTTNYDIDLPFNNQQIINPMPCQKKNIIINKDDFENYNDIDNTDSVFIDKQLNQLVDIYEILINSLSIANNITHNNKYINLREAWVHRLIEITALEANKYAALILYEKIKTNKIVNKLNFQQILNYNIKFSKRKQFIGAPGKIEGIFRGLYYNVKGHNETPEFVNKTHTQCVPEVLIKQIKITDKITDLPNLNKINKKDSIMNKILSQTSFFQKTENLGIALYSTSIRPHLNAKLYYYTYFTSPIRRIVDCMVQYCLMSDKSKCNKMISLFKNKLLNRTDINYQVEKYNLYLSVCNKIFKDSNEYITYYIKYGNSNFTNIYLPNLDITLTLNNDTLQDALQDEGQVKLIFTNITVPLDIKVINNEIITPNDLIKKQKELYFQNKRYPEENSYNYQYLNYRYFL